MNKKASQIIIAETNRLSETVDGLLYFSYLDTVNRQMMTEVHNLREILSSCDEKRVNRAFSNIVSNAIQYAQKTIRISCLVQGKKATVSIADYRSVSY